MLTIILYLITLCLLGILTLRRRREDNLPPGPYAWPVLGNLPLLRRLSRKYGGQHLAFANLSKTYGNVFKVQFASVPVIVVSGFEAIQTVLRSDVFDARPWNEFAKLRNMGIKKGITFAEGPEWREMRSWLVRSLRKLGFGKAEMSEKITEELKVVLEKLSSHKAETLRLRPIITPAIINLVWSIATGTRIDKDSQLEYFLGIMERRAQAFDMAGGTLSLFPWLRHVAPHKSGYSVLVSLNEELRSFLTQSITEHKAHYVKGQDADLIDMFLSEMYDGRGPAAGFTDDQLLLILVDIFIAVMDTTSKTLDFIFLHMVVYPEVQARVQKELDGVLGQRFLPNAADRLRLPYTDAVIAETQRLRLIVPIIGPRRALDETTINGYRIPKGSVVLMNLHTIHLDPTNFELPHSFRPERFIVKEGSFVPDKKLTFFGGGHRRCPGETVARQAIFLFFAGITKRYQLLPVPGAPPLDTEPCGGLTFMPKPYQVLLKERF